MSRLIDDFRTTRLSVFQWHSELSNKKRRAKLVDDLINVLSPSVLQDLPPSIQVEQSAPAISDWVTARAAESDVYCVKNTASNALVGLLILVQEGRKIHLGYLLAESTWGQGFGTELVSGFLDAVQKTAPVCLVGGVSVSNGASAHILSKLGFTLDRHQSTADTNVYTKMIEL
jgi:RimJ/RimL family protein N-acetyltransferase